jgi:hypothetical protein
MVKSLYFDLLKRSSKSEKTNREKLPKILNGRFSNSDDNRGMVKELYFDLLKRGGNSKMAKSNNDKQQHISHPIFRRNLGLVKELFFKLMKRGSADPKMTTQSNKAIMKIPNLNINDDIGKAKRIFFDPFKGGDNLRETNVPRANRQKIADEIELVKELYFVGYLLSVGTRDIRFS